jgi:Uma2 family endonuclease
MVGLVTFDEFVCLPDPREGWYELHHGEVVLIPPHVWGHQTARGRVSGVLTDLAGKRGVVLVGLGFQPAPEYEFWYADVGFVSAERVATTNPDGYLQGAPDVVVEVLSPSDTWQELNDRMAVCLENGCSSFWVVDRNRLSVTEGDVTRHYGISASFYCSVLDATIAVRDLFE